MKYSFIKPRTKYLVAGDTKFWLLFIATSISLLIGFSMFLQYKLSDMKIKAQDAMERQNSAKNNVEKIKKDIIFIKEQTGKAEGIYSSNLIIRDGIRNIFNLVPEQITLDSVEMKEKSLIIQGITPSKDIYKIGLLAPLKALFTTNDTTFYMLENGWFKFVSINKIEDFEGEIE